MVLRKDSILARSLVVVDQWWLAVSGILFIIGSDYKFRTRPPGQSLGGGIDSAIIFELLLYVLVAGYLALARFRVPKMRRVPLPLYLLCCFVGLAILSVAYSPYPQYALVRCLQVSILLAVVIVACMDADRAAFHRFAHLYMGLIAVSVLFGLAVPAKPLNNIQVGRFTWLAIHPTVSGAMMCLATVITGCYLITAGRSRPGPRWPTSLYVVVLVIVGGGALGAQTRGAIIGAIVGLLVVVMTSRGGRAVVEAALGLIVVGVGVVIGAGATIASYFQRGEDAAQLTSLNNRTDLWDLAITAFKQQPVFGHGITSARGIFFTEIGLGGGHNAAINLLVEVGLLGFGVWAAIVVTLVLGLRRLPREGHDGMGIDRSLLLGIITFLMIDAIFFEGAGAVANVLSTWFFFAVGWYVVAERSVRRDTAAASARAVLRLPARAG